MCQACQTLRKARRGLTAAGRVNQARAHAQALALRRTMGRQADRILKPAAAEWRAMTTRAILAGLRKGIPQGSHEDWPTQLADWGEIDKKSLAIWQPALFKTVELASSMTPSPVKKGAGFTSIAGPQTVSAWNWSLQNGGKLIVEINEETRAAISAYVRAAMAQGKPIQSIAKDIRGIVGLNSRLAEAVSNYEGRLLAEGVAAAAAAGKAQAYAGRLLRYRQEMIARTEKAFSLAEGIRAEHAHRHIENLEFVGDPQCCDECATMNGEVFTTEDAEGMIPVHPNCECTWVVAVDWEGEEPPDGADQPVGPDEEAGGIEDAGPGSEDLAAGPADEPRLLDFPYEDLDMAEKEALDEWVESNYTGIRGYFNGDLALEGADEMAIIEPWANSIAEMFDKYGSLEGARAETLYRGISAPDSIYQKMKGWESGSIQAIDLAPQSWSLDEVIAASFANTPEPEYVDIIFELERGRKGTLELDLSKTRNKAELEVVMKDTNFQVVKMQDRPIRDRLGHQRNSLHVWLREAVAKAAGLTDAQVTRALARAKDWKMARQEAKKKKKPIKKRAYARR